jgi:hypothetical protein
MMTLSVLHNQTSTNDGTMRTLHQQQQREKPAGFANSDGGGHGHQGHGRHGEDDYYNPVAVNDGERDDQDGGNSDDNVYGDQDRSKQHPTYVSSSGVGDISNNNNSSSNDHDNDINSSVPVEVIKPGEHDVLLGRGGGKSYCCFQVFLGDEFGLLVRPLFSFLFFSSH